MPSRALNRIIWVGVVVLLAVLAVRARDSIELLYAGVGSLSERDAPEEDSVYLRWRGRIDAPMAARLAESFERHRGGRRRFVVSLTSPGGSVMHGAEVVRLLRKIGETHSVETVIEAGSRCASMCVPVYLQGQRRTAAATAKFMFHEVSFKEYLARENSDVPAAAKGRATEKFFATYFKPAGVPEAWIAKVRADMAGGNDIWKTARELSDEGAGIVQRVYE